MIQVSNLSKYFDDFCAVNGINFTVQPGEVLGFLGPNGAGKSTTMKMLTGFLSPSSGNVSVMGQDVQEDPISAQKLIGYLPEGAPSYADMTAEAFLTFVGKARGYTGADLQQRIERVVKEVTLEKVLTKRVETLSKGYKRRLGLAQALIHDPKILILDEPTDGLDPNQKHQVRELIHNLSKDKIVIVSTHILEEVSAVCTRAMILADGEIVFDGTPDALAAKSDFHNAVTVRLNEDNPSVVEQIKQLSVVAEVRDGEKHEFIVIPKDGQSILADVNVILHNADSLVEELHVEVGRLDDVFRKVTASVTEKTTGGKAA